MRRIGLACAALIVLCACGRAPSPIEPTAAAKAHSSAPSAHDTDLKPPKLPAIAKRNDATGAANFVLYWVKVSNYASHTGETQELRAISDESCGGCASYARLYERTYAAGGFFKGSDWRLTEVEVEHSGDQALVSAHVSAPVGEFRQTSSSPLERGNDEESDLAFGVTWDGRRWRMSELAFQAEVVP
jgi:hypothetical protein